MVKLTSLAIHCLAFALCGMVAHGQEISSTMTGQKIQLAVHGGAGTIERSKMTPEKEQEYRTGLENALRAGREILLRRSEEHTSELQSRRDLVCRLLLEKKKKKKRNHKT